MTAATRVKICGLTQRADAEAAAAAGAAYGGVILAPGGKRSVEPEVAAQLLAELPLRGVGVFVNATPDALRRVAEAARLSVVQLHGDEEPELARALREEERWAVWKAIRPRSGDEFLRDAERFAGAVDGLLLDGWSASARGGTGSRFPWEEVAARRAEFPADMELIVAGGLDPLNVERAISLLRPAVVDVSSGVEVTPGRKDHQAVAAFVATAHRTR